jgi:hypothetical protein
MSHFAKMLSLVIYLQGTRKLAEVTTYISHYQAEMIL